MKKRDLLNYFDEELLEKLFGFCYARTGDSYEAEELCSDITYALIKAADTDGEIESLYPFIWKVARNVYADFSDRRAKRSGEMYAGDPEKALLTLAEEDISDDRREQLAFIYRCIAFLTRAYREVMILFLHRRLACFGDSNTSDGKYGVLRRLDNGRYAINFILFDKETAEKAHSIYKYSFRNREGARSKSH